MLEELLFYGRPRLETALIIRHVIIDSETRTDVLYTSLFLFSSAWTVCSVCNISSWKGTKEKFITLVVWNSVFSAGGTTFCSWGALGVRVVIILKPLVLEEHGPEEDIFNSPFSCRGVRGLTGVIRHFSSLISSNLI
ncbi:hypothetical protein Tco_0771454 [Tanacetum coccineum]|uniref:Uncharacterized protein n=1 Tax=Tanacetum coccineum TaxID=301880 RepID=A0ABQ4ZIU9_9ASTR